MFDVATIKSIAVGESDSLVAWTQSTVASSIAIETKLKTGRSGLTFEKGSRIVSAENVRNSIEDPTADAGEVNAELKALTQEAMSKLVSAVFNEDDFLGGGLLFKYESDKQVQELPSVDSFVGFEIDTCKANDFSAVISRIMLDFNGDQSVKMLLFNSQKKAPIYDETIAALALDTIELEVNWIMSNYKYGGKFYLGYLTAGLTASPMARNFELANLPSSFKNVFIRPISVKQTPETMFDPNNIVYSDSSTSWGINFDIQGYEDFTQTVRSNQRMFGRCLQLGVAVDVADLMLNSVRSNEVETMNKSAIVFELNGNVNNQKLPEKKGLYKLLALEEDRLRETFNPTGIIKMTIQR